MAVGDRNAASSFSAARVPMFPHNCAAVTKSDATTFAEPVAIMVLGAGDLVVTPYGVTSSGTNVTVTITADMIASGPFMLPFMVKKVLSTGTTATLIYGIW